MHRNYFLNIIQSEKVPNKTSVGVVNHTSSKARLQFLSLAAFQETDSITNSPTKQNTMVTVLHFEQHTTKTNLFIVYTI